VLIVWQKGIQPARNQLLQSQREQTGISLKNCLVKQKPTLVVVVVMMVVWGAAITICIGRWIRPNCTASVLDSLVPLPMTVVALKVDWWIVIVGSMTVIFHLFYFNTKSCENSVLTVCLSCSSLFVLFVSFFLAAGLVIVYEVSWNFWWKRTFDFILRMNCVCVRLKLCRIWRFTQLDAKHFFCFV